MCARRQSTSSDVPAEKALLRRWAKAQPRSSREESVAVAGQLARWLHGQERSNVLTYIAFPGEIALGSLAEELGDGHRFFVTRTPAKGPLSVHLNQAPYERHPFGFLQPLAESPELDPAEIDVVLTPGLCFDRKGGRLGWGRGYYDELLVRASGARAVGVTLSRLVVERVPLEAHDRPMTHLATERGITAIGR